MEIKPKPRGYKEGVLTETIRNVSGQELVRGQIVRYRRYKERESETGIWTGKYEWHYINQNNQSLIRVLDYLIEDNKSGES